MNFPPDYFDTVEWLPPEERPWFHLENCASWQAEQREIVDRNLRQGFYFNEDKEK